MECADGFACCGIVVQRVRRCEVDKERFLDVNGFSAEYDIPLEKRVSKYRKGRVRDSSRASISVAERVQGRSEAWKAETRHKQVVTAIVAFIIFLCVIAASVYMTFGM